MSVKNKNVIGTFSGECADANVTNENGLDITREVWENVFASEIYKQAIDLGWYLGFLGHPDDVDCMDFRNACVVMREGHIDDDGKVYGTFDLIDTPVGRVVKTFIDAGTKFGISVRGAGDIYNNSVDPETFVFRGFDLVTFPAYKEAIPEFKAIAASTDASQRQKYQSVCNVVDKELKDITSCEAIEVIKEQFPDQSETFKSLEDRKTELVNESNDEQAASDVKDKKIESLTNLYLEEKQRADQLQSNINDLTLKCDNQSIQMSLKVGRLQRIVADQQASVDRLEDIYKEENEKLSRNNKVLIRANMQLKKNLEDIKASSQEISDRANSRRDTIIANNKTIKKLQSQNLTYREKIEASDKLIAERDSRISKLEKDLDKTVIESSTSSEKLSDLESENESLKKQIKASQQLVMEYQDAYASMYSNALGVGLKDVTVTASTSVKELQSIIASSSKGYDNGNLVEPQLVDVNNSDFYDNSDLITV